MTHRHRERRRRRPAGPSGRDERKDAQLCGQVREALGWALADGDGSLSGAWIVEVLPDPHVGQLRVIVEVEPGEAEAARDELDRRAGALRYEVANAIHRKKTPTLTFVVVQREDAR